MKFFQRNGQSDDEVKGGASARRAGRGLRKGRGGMSAKGRGRMGKKGAGPVGKCVCTNPECDYQEQHHRGVPCYKRKCPKCGSPLTRQ